MKEHIITVVLESERPTSELVAVVHDLLEDLRQGFLGDESDWHTFTINRVSRHV
jgi:hypothetical protein